MFEDLRCADDGLHHRLRDTVLGLFTNCRVTLRSSRTRPWHSATFRGARQRFTFDVAGDRETTAHVAEAVAEHPFPLAGHIVADAFATVRKADSGRIVLEVELLTVEEN